MRTRFTMPAALLIISAILFSSCTKAVYSYRKKIKTDHTEVADAKIDHTPAAITTEENTIQEEEQPAYAAVTDPAVSLNAEALYTPVAAIPAVSHTKAVPAVVTQKAAAKALQHIYKKDIREKKLNPNEPHEFMTSTGGRWIIAGLILILIGALVGIFAQPFGWIISTIGGIILIVGLIFLLLELL